MKPNHGILLGITFIAAVMMISFANAESTAKSGKYTLSSSEGVAYRLNTETGEISVCIRGMTMEEKLGCTPWTK